MSNNKLQVILNEQGVAKENAKQLLEAFGAPFEEAGEILKDYKAIVVTSEKQTDLMVKARTKRLALKKTRVEVEHRRKELKADILKTGQAIDSVAKFVKQVIEPAEDYLQLQEDFAEIQKAKRLEERKAKRIEKLSKYTDDVSAYNLDEMGDEAFERLILMLKDIKAREEAEAKIAEEKRIAEAKAKAEEDERIRKENARLKAEAEARERKHEKERKEQEKKVKLEREKAEAERKERERLEAEVREREEAAVRKLAEAEEARKKAASAPDKDKLLAYADSISRAQLPEVITPEAKAIVNNMRETLNMLVEFIREEAREL